MNYECNFEAENYHFNRFEIAACWAIPWRLWRSLMAEESTPEPVHLLNVNDKLDSRLTESKRQRRRNWSLKMLSVAIPIKFRLFFFIFFYLYQPERDLFINCVRMMRFSWEIYRIYLSRGIIPRGVEDGKRNMETTWRCDKIMHWQHLFAFMKPFNSTLAAIFCLYRHSCLSHASHT